MSVSRDMARHWDHEVERRGADIGLRGLVEALVVLLVARRDRAVGAGHLSAGDGAAERGGSGLSALAMVAITGQVDHTLPPVNDSRAVLAWIVTALLALGMLVPSWSERIYSRAPFAALALVPGLFFVSFPTNTQLHAALVVAIGLVAAAVAAVAREAAARSSSSPSSGCWSCCASARSGTTPWVR
ncbi:MAG: hypothetical protein U0263_38440 [Polyangiaceae bacterium]